MSKFFIISLTIIAFCVIPACEQKPLYPKHKKSRSSKKSMPIKKTNSTKPVKKNKTSNVGIADVADYATGMTQLKTKQFSKKKLTDSYTDRNTKLEEAMKGK
jgi:hypothetical protein